MEKLEIESFLDYKYLSDLCLSPDSKMAAFNVRQANYAGNDYISSIWCCNTENGNISKVTDYSFMCSGHFLWLNDDMLLYADMVDCNLQKEAEKGAAWTVYYKIGLNGAEAEEYMRIPLKVNEIKSLSEDLFVVKSFCDIQASETYDDELKVDADTANNNYEILDEIPFWLNGEGFTNKKRNRLYLYDRRNKSLKAVTERYGNVLYYNVCKSKILYIMDRYEDVKGLTMSLNIYDAAVSKTEIVVSEGSYRIDAAEFYDDGVVFAGSDMLTYGINQIAGYYSVKNNKTELLAEHESSFGNSIAADCRLGGGRKFKVVGNKVYLISTQNLSSYIKIIDDEGCIKTLTEDVGSVDCFDTDGNKIVFIGLRNLKLQELYLINASGKENQMTCFNENIVLNFNLSIPERTDAVSSGNKIEGFVLKPAGYDSSKKYPAILNIHGGPDAAYGDVFFHEMQVLSNEGYFVLFCNPRGSNGRGSAFSDIRGKYGTVDYDDLICFTEHVMNIYPQIDINRLGVAGGSYGGYMTNWIIGHTNMFKCAVSQRCISNWITQFGTSDIGYYYSMDQNAATPWYEADELWRQSPLKYAEAVTTPTLFIHSTKDYTCNLAEGLQMFTALKYHGVESRMCIIRGENHELSRSGKPQNRIKRLTEILNWFNKFLK